VRLLVVALLVATGLAVELVVHAGLGITIVYTHFFYLIVAIAGLWYGRRAVLLALLLGGLHVVVTLLLTGSFPVDALLRAAMLCTVAFVIGTIEEERDRYRRELEERNAQLQASEEAFLTANRKLNLLASITRHDITNQLTVLLGRIDLLADEVADPAVLAGLERERESVRTIQHLIAFTKDYQEIGVHAPRWHRMGDCIGTTHGDRRGEIAFSVDLDDLEVYADPMLERICENLVDNSIRHGEHVRAIAITCRPTGDGVTVLYQDDGVGVPTEEKERIFEKGVGKHTGFGLFLTREILAITGISIRETGEPGRGARFEIRVPAGRFRFGTDEKP
jgi:signal transduction histidine kinase